MTIFSGLKGYKWQRDNNVPSKYFRDWLKEKWKADIKMIGVTIILSPLLVFWIFGGILAFVGAALMNTKNLLPDSIFLENSYRDKQFAAAEAARAFLAVRDGLAAPVEALCEDEGCPYHGTPHICVDKKDPAG